MPAVVRIGDSNEAGGRVTSGPSTVFVNGKQINTHISEVTPHGCCGKKGCSAHCSAKTTKGSSTVYAAGKPVVFVGVKDTCGHTRTQGSSTVFVGA